MTNQELTDDEIKEMALKRLKELSENPTSEDIQVEGLTEEQEQWLQKKLPNDPFEVKSNDKGPNSKEVIEQASEEIMKKHKFITIEETGEIWYYDNGVYVPGGEILIAKQCEKMFDYDLNNERLSQIKGHIMRRTYHKHNELDSDINIINLKKRSL